jgi:uncharacterized protein YggU (UPF0235/DUF167 family)
MYIRVRVIPNAKKDSLEKDGELIVVTTREPAKGNRANHAMRTMVAAFYGVPVGRVKILTGHHSQSKLLVIELE